MSFIREANAEPLPGYRLIEPLGSGGFGECKGTFEMGGLMPGQFTQALKAGVGAFARFLTGKGFRQIGMGRFGPGLAEHGTCLARIAVAEMAARRDEGCRHQTGVPVPNTRRVGPPAR